MIETGLIEITNLGLTIILLLEVATMKQNLKQSENVEYTENATMQFIKGVKP